MKCAGKNCNAINGYGHSQECIREHDENTDPYNTPGNRNPEARYAGYKNIPLKSNATEDEKLAWDEGRKAALN